MKRVVCYCRVSTEEEKQLNALQKQIEELELFVQEKIDWKLIDTYVDEGKSGTTTKGRPSYQKLYADLLTDRFDIVLIKDQSRLMRNVLDWYQFLDRLVNAHKELYLYMDNCFYTPNDKFITGIKAMMAEEYSRDLSKRIGSAAYRSQKNGTAYGNSRILGYKQNKGRYEIVPEEAEIVKQIFEWYSNGDGCRTILNKLKDKGITSSTGTDFSASTLKRMLKNEKYKGLLVSRKTICDFETKKIVPTTNDERIIIPNGIPAIISEELWNKCAEIRQARVNKFKSSKNSTYKNKDFFERYQGRYPLSGKIICGICGSSMFHDTAHGQQQYKRNQQIDVSKWGCRNYRYYGLNKAKGGCENTRVYDREIMNCLRQVIFNLTSQYSQSAIQKITTTLKTVLSDKDDTSQIKVLEKNISNIKIKISKLLDMLLDGTIDKSAYNLKKDELDLKLESAQVSLADLQTKKQLDNSKEARLKATERFLSTIYENPQNITDEIISSIVNRIVIKHDESMNYTAEIYLNLLSNSDKHITSTQIYKTTYPFIKQKCRKAMEDWQIVVYA